MTQQQDRDRRRQVWSWAMYDWANSAFATTVMAGFFPLFFKDYWNVDVPATTSTWRLGVANAVGSLAIVVLAPVTGAIADAVRGRRRFLFGFALLGVVSTGALYLVAQGAWAWAASLYVLATVGFMGGNVFYDALLVGVAPEGREDQVSGLGYALGYLGGGLLFVANVLMTLFPESFGLADQAQAVRTSFVTVAVWWALFAIPLFAHVREPSAPTFLDAEHAPVRGSPLAAVRSGFAQLRDTFRDLRRMRVAFTFLVAYWLYIDGVDTIIRMAVDYGMAIGLESTDLITALIITQFVGFPAALAFGWMGGRIGPKRAILLGIGVYIGVTVFAATMDSALEFFVLAAVVGLVQGGVQALSRSLFARMVPPGRSGQFFGFYNMIGKFAAIVGPVLVGGVGILTGEPRTGILAVIVLFVGGGALLMRVDVQEGERQARAG
jgi:MFS transporter, UMF1 family